MMTLEEKIKKLNNYAKAWYSTSQTSAKARLKKNWKKPESAHREWLPLAVSLCSVAKNSRHSAKLRIS